MILIHKCHLTQDLLQFSSSSDIHEEKSQDDDNHKTEQKYLETHFL